MAIRLKDTASVNISGSAGSAGSATKATQDASGNVITSTYATKSELTSGLSGKVDKVSGKGLSTNDFTTALKTKLEGLSNYDDTALTTAVNNLTTRFNTLLETDTTAAIESFNEIIAFLNGIADTETLEGIVAGIESQISTVEGKIPTKVSQLTNDSGYVKNTAVATSSALGLIKSGGDITVASDGTVSVADNSHTHTIANITNLQTTLDGKASTAVATASSDGLMSAEDKAALDGLITTGGEVNQNAFSNVKVGSTTIAADSKTDTLELAAGTNVTLTPDATNDKVTIAAKDTTYTFANGTNGFTVTPSGGTAQTVTVTPSIANNVTGSGTSGYLTKFNGANSVTNGPQLGTSTTTYLRNDGTWATPKDTTYSALSATDATAGTATTGRLISAKVLHDKITEMLPDEVTTTEGDTGLMTAADKSKLDGIAEGANKYTHPTYTAKSSGLYKITVDGTGHVSGTTAVAKADITALGIPGSDTNTTYTFTGGTNKITVDPSNADAYDVTITPSIANNVTGSGTSGSIAKFNGANSVTNGPAFGSSTSTYLRNDGTWATPPNSNTIPSAYCSTAAGTAAKAASCTGYVLTANTYLHLNLTAANSAQSALTLNVNSTGAKNIYINGSASSSSNYTLPAGTYVVFYDGTQFQLRTDGVLPGKILAAKNADTVNGLTVLTAVPANAKFTDNNTTYSAGKGLTLSSTTFNVGAGTGISVADDTVGLATSGVTAGTYGDDEATRTLTHSDVFDVPQITVDAYGRITSASTKTLTLPASGNTDTKVTSVGNHYTPAEDTSAAISAASGTATNITGTAGKLNVVTGVKRDAKGHIVGVTSANIYSTDNNTTYSAISSDELSTGTATTSRTVTAAVLGPWVKSQIDSKIAAADAMIYKGTIGSSGATISELPSTTAKTGWTYKVATAGTYDSKACEVGDMIICLTDGSSSTAATWTVVQNNIDGAVTGPASSTDAHIAVFNGATGKVIKDSGFTIGKSVPSNAVFTDTKYSAGNGLTLSGTTFNVGAGTGISVSADSVGLATSGVTAGTYGPSSNVTGSHGATINVPSITVDAYGRVTSISNKTYTSQDNNSTSYLPLSGGTLSGNLNFSGTSFIHWNNGSYQQRIYLTDDSSAGTAVFTFQQSSDTASTWKDLMTIKDDGTVVATIFSGSGSGLTSLNGSNISSGTVAKARLGAHSHAYTPKGSVSSSFTGSKHSHTFTGTAASHDHSFTGSAVTSGGPSKTTSVYSITGVGSLPSLTASYDDSTCKLSISLSAGSLPTRSSVSLASSDHTHSVTAAGTVGSKSITPAGSISETTAGGSVSSSFTGTASTATTIS